MSVQGPETLDQDQDAPELSRRPVVAGVAAGLWALLVGVGIVSCLVMLAWAVSPNSQGDSAAAWRAAGYTWLGAHQVPLQIAGQPLTLLPLGALALGLLLTRRGGRWAGRLLPDPTLAETAAIVATCSLAYGAGGAGVAWLSGSPKAGADPVHAFLATAVVAGLGATWGIAREAGLVARARARMSEAAWRTLMGGLAAVGGLVAAGAALATISLVRHLWEISATLADLDAGVIGVLSLTIVGALSLPTLDIWALSVIVGPGFGLGTDNGLNVLGGQMEVLPALPVLAAIPTAVPTWAPVVLLVPVALGVLAGRVRWGRDLPTLAGVAASGVGLAGVVAVLVAALALLASGSLGGGRLADVGPAVLPVAGAAAGLVLLGFLGEAGFQSVLLDWELYRTARRSEVVSPGSTQAGPASPVIGAGSEGALQPADVDLTVDLTLDKSPVHAPDGR